MKRCCGIVRVHEYFSPRNAAVQLHSRPIFCPGVPVLYAHEIQYNEINARPCAREKRVGRRNSPAIKIFQKSVESKQSQSSIGAWISRRRTITRRIEGSFDRTLAFCTGINTSLVRQPELEIPYVHG
jgi:hypothetical protein